MLTRIQLRAIGATAHEVEAELHDDLSAIKDQLGLDGSIAEQVISGTPGKSFDGRLTYAVHHRVRMGVVANG